MFRTRVFTTGSMWSLLIYLLYSSEEEINRTKYFFSDTGIHPSVAKNFNCHIFNTTRWERFPYKFRRFSEIFMRFIFRFRWPYLVSADFYGIDQGIFNQSIIGNNFYTLIEDGIGDYNMSRETKVRRYESLKQLLFGKISGHDFGNNDFCKKIILTLEPTNSFLKSKGEKIDIYKLWRESPLRKKEIILSKFNISHSDLEELQSRKIIVLTQPLSEDNIITEEEKIELYRELLKNESHKDIVIKIHPRERTDYNKWFPDVLVFDKRVPMQLFNIIGLHFAKAMTLCSTSVTGFGKDTQVVFAGTEIHENIVKAYGHIDIHKYIN